VEPQSILDLVALCIVAIFFLMPILRERVVTRKVKNQTLFEWKALSPLGEVEKRRGTRIGSLIQASLTLLVIILATVQYVFGWDVTVLVLVVVCVLIWFQHRPTNFITHTVLISGTINIKWKDVQEYQLPAEKETIVLKLTRPSNRKINLTFETEEECENTKSLIEKCISKPCKS
jgi:hypothetical protein